MEYILPDIGGGLAYRGEKSHLLFEERVRTQDNPVSSSLRIPKGREKEIFANTGQYDIDPLNLQIVAFNRFHGGLSCSRLFIELNSGPESIPRNLFYIFSDRHLLIFQHL